MIVVVGDVLLDRDVEGDVSRLTPDAPAPVLHERQRRVRPGGAGLAAALAADDGAEVTLVTALADDDAGRELAALLDGLGVRLLDLGLSAPTAEKIRLRSAGVTVARLDRGVRATAEDLRQVREQDLAGVLDDARAVLVSCYGRGLASHPTVRTVLADSARRVPLVWDPHTRGAEPVEGAALVAPNEDEARAFVPEVEGDGLEAVTRRAGRLRARWAAASVAVTLSRRGALLVAGDGLPLVAPAPHAPAADTCGAGDRFAATVTALLAQGRLPSEAVTGGVAAASRFVAGGGAAAFRIGDGHRRPRQDHDPFALARQVQASGGTVVAAGGCFDLLHTGHLEFLESARALGDCLIVCLNGDESVGRLKGAGRPIVPQEDRAALLRAMTCVDEVALFDEDTPVEVLRLLRPDIFAKGGDYRDRHIPEAELLASWGGQAVTLPYVKGRSTTRILEEVVRRERT